MAIKAEVKNVTPKLAKKFMEKNSSNRPISKRRLHSLIKALKNGEFVTTHQGIAFYENGVLADGQHRLQAVIDSDVTIKVLIITGIPKTHSTVMAIDSGKGRSVVDSSKILGDNVKHVDITISRMLEYGAKNIAEHPTYIELKKLVKKYEEELLFIKKAFCKKVVGVNCAAVKAAVAVAYQHVDEEDLINFTEVLQTGISDNESDGVIIQLRDYLISNNHSGSSARIKAYLKTQLAIKHYMDGNTPLQLKTPSNAPFKNLKGKEYAT